MAKIYSFEEARHRKFNQGSYVAPSLMEHVPDDIQEALQINNAEMLRRTLKVARTVIKSVDIPPKRELNEDEQPPAFEYPSSEEK